MPLFDSWLENEKSCRLSLHITRICICHLSTRIKRFVTIIYPLVMVLGKAQLKGSKFCKYCSAIHTLYVIHQNKWGYFRNLAKPEGFHTRMQSSRMRTARRLTVCGGGGGGVCLLRGGSCLLSGGSFCSMALCEGRPPPPPPWANKHGVKNLITFFSSVLLLASSL